MFQTGQTAESARMVNIRKVFHLRAFWVKINFRQKREVEAGARRGLSGGWGSGLSGNPEC
jgi:hypothetical protein